MATGAPAAGAASRTGGAPAACPRCGAQIAGDFKFCPACALRLRRASAREDDRERRRPVALAVGVALALVSLAGVGFLVLRPRPTPPPAPVVEPAPPDWESYVRPPLTVDGIPADLVDIPQGYAYEVSIDRVPGLDEATRNDIKAAHPTLDVLKAWISYRLRVMRYEVTRGQYDEFLRDVHAQPDGMPDSWREGMEREIEKARRLDAERGGAEPRPEALAYVDAPERYVLHKVPRPWAQWRDGRVVGWSVSDAERNLPVTYVSAVDAGAFAQWASARLGIRLRLPAAMEWVRAARAGRDDAAWQWPWGGEPLRYACNNAASFGKPQWVHYRYSEPIGTGGATPEGLFSMAGNVAEWALDHDVWVPTTKSPLTAPYLTWRPFPDPPTRAFAYGGSFKSGIDDCRVDAAVSYDVWADLEDVGFRLVAFDD